MGLFNWRRISNVTMDIIDRKYNDVHYDLLDQYTTKLYKSNSFSNDHIAEHAALIELVIDQLHSANLMYLWSDIEQRLQELVKLPSAVYAYNEFNKKVEEVLETLALEEERGKQ